LIFGLKGEDKAHGLTIYIYCVLCMFYETGNVAPSKMIEEKMCQVYLYNRCEFDNCFVDCSKTYGKRAIPHCTL